MLQIRSQCLARWARGGTATLLLVTAVSIAPCTAAGILIDDFSVASTTAPPQALAQRQRGSRTARDSGSLGGVLGGTRQLTVNVTAPATDTSDSVTCWVNTKARRLQYASSVDADGSAELLYDAAGRGLNVNLSSAAAIRLSMNADASAIPYRVIVKLTDRSNHSASAAQTISVPGKQQVDIRLTGLRSVSLARISSLSITLDPAIAGDFDVSRIETVGTRKRGR